MFLKIVPGAPEWFLRDYFGPMTTAMKSSGIDTPYRIAAFIANIAVETGGFKWLQELDSYDGTYLKGQPYYPYYGRGLIHLTWESNYQRAGYALGLSLDANPDLAKQPATAARIAAWFWTGGNGSGLNLNQFADKGLGGFDSTIYYVNGGYNGYNERWRYYRAAITVLTEGHKTGMNNLDRGIEYLRPAIGQTPYVWWTSGIVPAGAPAFGDNSPPPPIKDVIQGGIFCAGVPNLILRSAGKYIPNLGNELYDGGTVAYWPYFKDYAETFDINKAYPYGTLIGRRYRDVKDQGHVAIVVNNGYVLQSYDGGGGWPGLNWDVKLVDSHAGYYYEYAVLPHNWINYAGDEWAKSAPPEPPSPPVQPPKPPPTPKPVTPVAPPVLPPAPVQPVIPPAPPVEPPKPVQPDPWANLPEWIKELLRKPTTYQKGGLVDDTTPSKAPDAKVSIPVFAGAILSLIAAVAAQFGYTLPPEILIPLTTVILGLVGYFSPKQ